MSCGLINTTGGAYGLSIRHCLCNAASLREGPNETLLLRTPALTLVSTQTFLKSGKSLKNGLLQSFICDNDQT